VRAYACNCALVCTCVPATVSPYPCVRACLRGRVGGWAGGRAGWGVRLSSRGSLSLPLRIRTFKSYPPPEPSPLSRLSGLQDPVTLAAQALPRRGSRGLGQSRGSPSRPVRSLARTQSGLNRCSCGRSTAALDCASAVLDSRSPPPTLADIIAIAAAVAVTTTTTTTNVDDDDDDDGDGDLEPALVRRVLVWLGGSRDRCSRSYLEARMRPCREPGPMGDRRRRVRGRLRFPGRVCLDNYLAGSSAGLRGWVARGVIRGQGGGEETELRTKS
jgi:hypothetical protein